MRAASVDDFSLFKIATSKAVAPYSLVALTSACALIKTSTTSAYRAYACCHQPRSTFNARVIDVVGVRAAS